MNLAEKILTLVAVILGAFVLFMYLAGDEKEENYSKLGSSETQDEGILGLFFIKEDIVPFLEEKFKKRKPDQTTLFGMVRLLAKKYEAKQDERIEKLFREILPVSDGTVKNRIYLVVGESGNAEVIDIVQDGLNNETDEELLLILLKNLSGFGNQILEDEALKMNFRTRLLDLYRNGGDEVKRLCENWLGFEVKELVSRAQKEAGNFSFTEAEKLFAEAAQVIPDSLYLNYAMGRYFFFTRNDRKKGSAILEKHGLLYNVVKTDTPPVIDGKLDDGIWEQSTSLKGFVKNLKDVSVPKKASIDVKGYIRYDRDHLYIGGVGYGDYTKLVARAKQRDDHVWEDDCNELFFDTKCDRTNFFQIMSNFEGVVFDIKYQKRRRWARSRPYNGVFKIETFLKKGEYWSIEWEIPWKAFGLKTVPAPGTVWGFNFAWVKQTKPAQYAQWAPTYGDALSPQYFGYLVFK